MAGRAEEAQTTCLLCLQSNVHLHTLPNPRCRHQICRLCILTRKKILGSTEKVVCPFCCCESIVELKQVGQHSHSGLRILSLDGGGVRGLIELRVLCKLEQQFKPLRVADLFDVIIGTNIGGIVALAVQRGVQLEDQKAFLKRVAEDVFDVSGLSRRMKYAMGVSICSNERMSKALQELFQDDHQLDYMGKPPYVFVTAYSKKKQRTSFFGNYTKSIGVWHELGLTYAERMRSLQEGKLTDFRRTHHWLAAQVFTSIVLQMVFTEKGL